MNDAHWHLALNHLPILLPIIGLLIMIGGFIFNSQMLKRAAYSVFIIGAISALVVFSTGDGAEDIVENIQGIEEHYIELHEETAEIFSTLLYILGGISIFGLWTNWKKKSFSKATSLIAVVFAVVVIYYAQQTATSGGEIRHNEIRTDNSANKL